MTRKHDAALVALISPTPLASKFFPGLAPKGTVAPYAVFWAMPGSDTVERQSGPYGTAHPRWTIHCVGSTVDQAEWVNEQIKGVLIVNGFGVIPNIVGENPGRFWYSNPIPVDRDDDSTPPLFWATAEAGFSSDIL